jgi:pimeloyl-ACP methyl ester carboxylesterase
LFRGLGDRCVQVAAGLGHDRFHYFGWTGGAALGLHLLVDQPDRLRSAILLGTIFPGAERRHVDRHLDVLGTLLTHGGLEVYTWWWLTNSVTGTYLEEHYDELAAMVDRRLSADATRRLDPDRVLRWLRVLFHPEITPAELAGVRTPTLVVATPGDVQSARRLRAAIPTAELAFVPGPAFAPYEMPDTFLAAIGPFLRAAASDNDADGPTTTRTGGGAMELRGTDGVTGVVEGRANDAVVFLHGWLMDPEDFRPQLDALAAQRIRAVALAQPAHGASAAPPVGFTMKDWAERTFAVLDQLGIEQAVLVGHSMGGMLALAMAEARPDRVAGLVLLATTDEPWDREQQEAYRNAVAAVALGWGPEAAAQLAPVLVGRAHLDRHPAFVGSWTHAVAGCDLAGMAGLADALVGRADLTARTPALDVPAAVLHGDADDAVDLGAGRRLAGRLPRASFTELAEAGHAIPLERPDDVTAAVLAVAQAALG